MSAYSTEAGVTFLGLKISASAARRSSGTFAIPSCTFVAPMRRSDDAPVRILNSDVLPTWGDPMMAVLMLD